MKSKVAQMEYEDVLKAYKDGPENHDSENLESHEELNPKKTRNRRSKLQPEAVTVNQLRTCEKSYQFISDRLKSKSISCHRSTVYRFLKKSRAL
ncbi:MAG: hypothetical protein WB870_12045 [Gallionellaceae bacterium]